jgi:hypothetical protein
MPTKPSLDSRASARRGQAGSPLTPDIYMRAFLLWWEHRGRFQEAPSRSKDARRRVWREPEIRKAQSARDDHDHAEHSPSVSSLVPRRPLQPRWYLQPRARALGDPHETTSMGHPCCKSDIDGPSMLFPPGAGAGPDLPGGAGGVSEAGEAHGTDRPAGEVHGTGWRGRGARDRPPAGARRTGQAGRRADGRRGRLGASCAGLPG